MTSTTLLAAVLTIAAVPSVVDCGVRAVLLIASRRKRKSGIAAAPRCLVLVPARDEGAAVEATLSSATSSLREGDEVILLLDGADAVARALAASLRMTVVEKSPPGPSKAAALAWFAENHGQTVERFGCVMVLDAGSRLSPSFFERLEWTPEADAIQALLAGEGSGVGEAAAISERRAQRWEDRGRCAIGWNPRLRGTGMLLTPSAFRSVMPRVRTKVEDWETTLLLSASGRRITLASGDAFVVDVKPDDVKTAAAQRARWLVGQVALPLVQGRDLLRLIARSPGEGFAFAAELFARPRSFFLLLRAAAVAALLASAPSRSTGALAALVAATCLFDLALLSLDGMRGVRSGSLLVVAWLRSLTLLPSAITHWLRGRRP